MLRGRRPGSCKATTFEDPQFALKLSQVQRDRLHQELQELLRRGEFLPLPHWKMKIQTIQTDMKLLDSRDRTAARLLQTAAKPPSAPRKRAGAKMQAPTEAEASQSTLRDPAPNPPPPMQDSVPPPLGASLPPPSQASLPPPLRGRAGVGGLEAPDLPPATPPEAHQPQEVLRNDPPRPAPRRSRSPSPPARPNRLVPTLVDAVRLAMAQACAPPTAGIAIVPERQKAKADKAPSPFWKTCARRRFLRTRETWGG